MLCVFSTQGELTIYLVFTILTWLKLILVRIVVCSAYCVIRYWTAIEPSINV